MREDIDEKIIEEGKYIVENKATVRMAGKHFHIGKSTIHKDVTDKLFYLDRGLYLEVKKVLKVNLLERHIRGGEATKQKYLKAKKKNT